MPIQVLDVRAQYEEPGAQTMKLLIAGPPGAGKTRFSSTFPNVLYADCEGNLLSVRDRPVRAVRINSSKDLEELRNALDQRREIREQILGGPVDTVCIDTADELARILMRERLQSERKEAFTQPDWGIHGDKLRDILRGFRNLQDIHVIITVHVRAQTDEESGRVEYKPAIQGSVGHEIAEYVNECLLLRSRARTDPRTGEKQVERYLQTYGDTAYPWLKDHSGALPPEFPVDLTTDYERLTKLIFGGAPAPVERPPVSERVQEATDWKPEDEPTAPPRKKAAAKKKAVTEPVREPSTPQGDEAPAQDVVSPPPDTGVSEIETESPEPEPVPPVEEPTVPACAVCGETDIPKNYLLLSDARFEQTLCRVHFHERIDKK